MGKYAIFIVSALIFSMLTYSSALRNALFQSEFRNIESFSQLQASNIANSAALVAINDIRNDSDSDFAPEEGESYAYPSSTGFADWEDLAGSYNLQVTNQADTLLVINSTGRFDETDYRVSVGLTKGGTSEWTGASVDKAIHSESSMDLGNGYVEGDVSVNKTFSNFSGRGNADVDGDLYFVDADMLQSEYEDLSSGTVDNIHMLREPITHTNPVFPQFPVNSSTSTYNSNNETLDFTGQGAMYNSFTSRNTTINTGSEDTESKLYVKDLDLSKDLQLNGDGHLSIYVENTLELGNGNINSSGESKNFTIYYKGTDDIDYTGNGTFRGLLFAGSSDVSIKIAGNPTFDGNLITYGDEVNLMGTPENSALVYAPYASVTIGGSAGSFRGAIVSDTFQMNGRPSVIYDEEFANSLPQLEQEDNNEYVLMYWN
ncbi:MAG: hypothetical protein U5K72_07950 [Balneolaceae bacterium]|nr:hypothetical protein [Balneolaceae bacterium]